MKRIAGPLICAALLSPLPLAAQAGDGFDLEPYGFLRIGLEVEPESSGRGDGFLLYDARIGLRGEVGFLFDYEFGLEFDRQSESIDLLDASLAFPIGRSGVRVSVGGFRSPVGREATKDKALLGAAERSQLALALAPGRQVGLQVAGDAADTRFRWAVGLFNGNGLRWENDDDAFLVAGRLAFNSVGDLEFYEDFVVEAGVSVAATQDDSQAVMPVGISFSDHTGDRRVYGGDLRFAYHGWTVAGELLRARYDDPAGPGTIEAEGFSADLRHMLWGVFDLGVRYDAFRPALAPGGGTPADNDFVVLSLHAAPGPYAHVGFQYSIGVDGAVRGLSGSLDGTNTAPPLADGQFLLFLQVAY
jgi:hypothetical protein